MPYQYLEDVTTADLAIEATGDTLQELLQSAAEATITSMADPASVKPKTTKTFTITKEKPEDLLFDLIEELIFLKDSESMVFCTVTTEYKDKTLTVTLKGDKIDHTTQELRQDLKAITLHYYTVEQTKDGWHAQFVIDI